MLGFISETAAIVGLLTAVLVLMGLVGRVFLDMYRWSRRIENAIAYVESEMKLNGGKTVRDAIKRIEDHLGIEQPREGRS